MKVDNLFKREVKRFKQHVSHQVRLAEKKSSISNEPGDNINVLHRKNASVVTNVGADGSVEEASTKQDVGPIRQVNTASRKWDPE